MAFQVMLYQILVYCISDIGLIRRNNEDSLKLLTNEQFFVLADGMGGHQAGEVASRKAVDELCYLFQWYFDSFYKELPLVQQLLKEIIQEVNILVYRMGKENSHLRGMGTTLCCLFFHPEGLIYGHVGDSRIYRFRQGRLEQLTQDHSLVQELIDLGQLSEKQAEDFLYKNIITKAIGTESSVEPSVSYTPLEKEDMILMCTDGLSDLVNLEEMQKIISQNSEEEIPSLLVKRAKERGGYDNITVVLVKVKNKYEPHLS